jgi:2-polyprenyl-3-methyl-5-hydroxy-6-metoxy-1,4-benzoquinol methylase
VFVPPDAWPAPEAEKARYDTHRNDPDDPAYRGFLARLAEPLLARVAPGARGLDFGCGPGPALAAMLRERGLHVTLYDPFYHPDASVWSRAYDFITATEVVEHLRHPAREFDRLFGALAPGGWLAVMTQPVRAPASLDAWHYARDSTHICFYHPDTFRYIAARWNAELTEYGGGVVMLQRRGEK